MNTACEACTIYALGKYRKVYKVRCVHDVTLLSTVRERCVPRQKKKKKNVPYSNHATTNMLHYSTLQYSNPSNRVSTSFSPPKRRNLKKATPHPSFSLSTTTTTPRKSGLRCGAQLTSVAQNKDTANSCTGQQQGTAQKKWRHGKQEGALSWVKGL